MEVFDLEGGTKNIAGIEFRGAFNNPTLEENWNLVRSVVLEKAIEGNITLLDYPKDSLPNNQIHQFIGINIEGTMAEIPSSFEVRTYEYERKLAVFLSMHPLVRPRPQTIQRLISEKAKELGYTLLPFYVETHFQDNSLIVEGLIKN